MSDAKDLRVAILREYSRATNPRVQEVCGILYDLVSDDVFAGCYIHWLLTHLSYIIATIARQSDLSPNAVEDTVIIEGVYVR